LTRRPPVLYPHGNLIREDGATSIELVRALYDQRPHATLYAPLCKLEEVLGGCEYLVSTDGQRLSAMVAFTNQTVEFTWSLAGRAETLRNLIAQAQHRTGGLFFAPALETGRKSWSQMLGLPVLGRFFRTTLRDPQSAPSPKSPREYEFASVDPAKDLPEVSRLINEAYPSLQRLTRPERLEAMARRPYYFPEGWFFLRHRGSGQRIGVAISGSCPKTGEGFIEWTQVSRPFRHRGLGAALVHEQVRRLAPRSRFITAAGSLDAPFVLGDLYRECGFGRTRHWTLLGRNSGTGRRRLALMFAPESVEGP